MSTPHLTSPLDPEIRVNHSNITNKDHATRAHSLENQVCILSKTFTAYHLSPKLNENGLLAITHARYL